MEPDGAQPAFILMPDVDTSGRLAREERESRFRGRNHGSLLVGMNDLGGDGSLRTFDSAQAVHVRNGNRSGCSHHDPHAKLS